MTTNFDCLDDLEIDSSVTEESDFGFRFDKRMMTRISAPELWSNESDLSNQILPDCAALVRRAARAKVAGDTIGYEKFMRQLVQFFGNAVPVRTGDEVRKAFRLGEPSKKDLANQREIELAMQFLDAKRTSEICCGPLDLDRLDALVEADKERQRFTNAKNTAKNK